jgi:large subunit ribosomal protein L18
VPKHRYIPIFRRRREGKTNYHKRKKLIVSRRPFLYVYVSDKNITAQVMVPEKRGDRVLASVHSRELLKYGWKGGRKSTPAAYLVGFLVGKK